MSENYVFRVRYSEKALRRAVFAYVLHMLDGKALLIGAGIAGIFHAGYLALYGQDRAFAGFISAFVAFFLVFIAMLWIAHLRHTLARFKRMKVPEAVFTLTGDSLTAASDYGSTTLLWSTFKEIWDCGECWLLLLERNHFITLPIADVSECALDLIRAKIPKYAPISRRVRDRPAR
jgi:hypothetical protein